MKSKDKQILKTKTLKELQNDLDKAIKELVELKLKLKTNKLKDLHSPAKKRHQIAIIKTLITQKQLLKENK